MTRVWVILVHLGAVLGTVHTRPIPAARFQIGDKASNNSFLDAGYNALPSLTQVSVCTHINLRRLWSYAPITSYTVQGSVDEFLVEIDRDQNAINVACCKKQAFGLVRIKNLPLHEWKRLCISLDLKVRQLEVMYDGEFGVVSVNDLVSTVHKEMAIKGGGRLVVGMRVNDIKAESFEQALDGAIADYRLYDFALTREEMLNFYTSGKLVGSTEPLIDLENGKLQVSGPTMLMNVSERELLNEDRSLNLLFPTKMNYEEADQWCRKMKGTLSLPKNSEENVQMYNAFRRFSQKCIKPWANQYWIGAFGNVDDQIWESTTDRKPITYENFLKGWEKPSTKFQCITMIMEQYMWAASACSTKTCVVCNFSRPPTLRVRGLCRKSLLDRSFTLLDYEGDQLVFVGRTHTDIKWMDNSWVLQSRTNINLSARIVGDKPETFPKGLHTWHVKGDQCYDTQMKLLLTFCHENEYTCEDGTCIPIRQRCDLIVNCPDYSDEMNCSLIDVPEGYPKHLPPPSSNSGTLNITFSFNITSLRELDLVSSTIRMDVLWQLKWADERLKYYELRETYHQNRLEDPQLVWQPQLKARDGTGSVVDKTPRSDTTYVMRLGQPFPDDTFITEDHVYSGSENVLVREEEHTLSFRCDFELQMYPFDRQRCSVVFSIRDYTEDFCRLAMEDLGFHFLGSSNLREYNLVGKTFTVYTKDAASHVKIELKFKNLFGFYLSNTFLPTLMLDIICCTTLCFDVTDFQDRIMVSLTSLLVMATIFVQTSENITKTSYLKFIDLWFVALMSEDFLIIIGLVLIESLRAKDVVNKNMGLCLKKDADLAHRVNRFLLVFFSMLLVTMVACFVLLCYFGLNGDD